MHWRTLILTVVLGVVLGTLAKDSTIVPLTRSSLVGEWSGFETNGPSYCRLHLREDGAGALGTIARRGPLLLWRISAWKVSDSGRLTLTATPATNTTGEVLVEASCALRDSGSVIELRTRSRHDGTRTQVFLLRKSEEVRALHAVLTNRMDDASMIEVTR